MSDLTLIGLGAMGSAIAGSLLEGGCDLTFWNRTPGKARQLTEMGGRQADSLEQAIAASPLILVCIHGYAATKALLGKPQIASLLRGKTLIQMSTGTPAEAREAETWVEENGASYLDCAILMYPESIGTAEGQLLVAGPEHVYRSCGSIFPLLGGDIRYLGSSIGAAATLDLAVVSRLMSNTIGIVYGAYLCESEGVPLAQFADLYAEGDRASSLALKIAGGDFDRDIAATVGTSIEVASSIRNLTAELGINSELPDFILGLYRRAADAGYLAQDNASLIEVFRGNA